MLTWLTIEARRRWRALLVLALLVALTAGTVLAVVAGARRGQSAFDRLWAGTRPATVTVLANQPGFDWSKVAALPEVSATGLVVAYAGATAGFDGIDLGYPPANAQTFVTVERPVVLQGRMASPGRADEVVVTPHFLAAHHLRVGDQLTIHLSSPAQASSGFDASTGGQPQGPRVMVRIVGAIRSPFYLDSPGDSGDVLPTYAFYLQYRPYIVGDDPARSASYVNAFVRLNGGEAQIPAFRADLARVSGRSDIDVWDNYAVLGGPVRKASGYEAACLFAFGLVALLAALFLVGQAVARYADGTVEDLRVLRAVGLTRWQAAVCAAVAPGLAAAAGATLGVAAALVASRWMPIGIASFAEPAPGIDADWLVLGTGWAAAVVLVAAASIASTWLALPGRRVPPARRKSAVVTVAARLPVPAMVGARFALERGPGRSAPPVFPAVAGAVAGVLGVLAAFTFAAGVSDAVANPARTGVTWQLETFYGQNGQDFGPAAQVSRAVAASPDVAGFLDIRVGSAQAGAVSVESFDYAPVEGKRVPVVLTAGRMPRDAAEIVLAPATARMLQAGVGSAVQLTGGPARRAMTVTGIGFVPTGPDNSYDEGAWLTPAGFSRLFLGAPYAFKFHLAAVTTRPGADPRAAASAITAAAAAVPGGAAFSFTPPAPPGLLTALRQMALLPSALGAFLAVLAVGAVGYALACAVRRRRRELAVLRALGLTGRQARLVIVTQATLLAMVGLAAGVPLGLAVGRDVWRAVAGFIPLAYQPPFSPWALALIAPAVLVCANLLALQPGGLAARLRPGEILRAE